MILATSNQIKLIDEKASDLLGIPLYELIGRAGEAVAKAVRELVPIASKVIFLAGKGNNGADGYAAAKLLLSDYDVLVYDVFGVGQKGEDGKRYFDEFCSLGGIVRPYSDPADLSADIAGAVAVIDAIFGTGIGGKLPDFLLEVAEIIRGAEGVIKIAVDLPLGVRADDGSIDREYVYQADATVTLCLPKPAHYSYPAKKYVGKVIFDNINLQIDSINDKNEFLYRLVDDKEITDLLPIREDNSNKGSFGKLLMITGSSEYSGAGRLSLEAALRGGVGLVTCLTEHALSDALLKDFPEAIYKERKEFSELRNTDMKEIIELANKHNAVLIGSGCARSSGLFNLVTELLSSYSGYLILDADAINVLSENGKSSLEAIRDSSAKVIITPHPLEFARLSGLSVEAVNAARISAAREFSQRYNCITVLKGAATVTTDGERVFINSSGSSALAKAGSGDVLAGALASLVASSSEPLLASAAAAYLHGRAADDLSDEFSTYGVTPSDLPRQIARNIAKITNNSCQ